MGKPESTPTTEDRIRTEITKLEGIKKQVELQFNGVENQLLALRRMLEPEPTPEPVGPDTPPGTM